MEMRKSRVLRQMRNGKIATSIKLNFSDSAEAELAAMCGFDCVWIDMEHVPTDWTRIGDTVRACKAHDCDVLTRVAKGCYSDLIRPLEADSTGIMVPHLMSLEEAKQIVYFTKFHPIGRRPLDGGNSDGAYCLMDTLDYMKQANDQRFVVVQIEDPEPLAELEEIAALPGIDMLFFGPADFSQGAGIPCDFSNPIITETQKRVADAARRHGKFVGTTGDPESFDALADMGYTFINLDSDVGVMITAFTKMASDFAGKDIK